MKGIKANAKHHPDLIFPDIQMPKINGFEMPELLPPCPPVIFTTAFDEYAIKAFEANAIDYLLKPFGQERLDTALAKWRNKIQQSFENERIEALINESVRHPEDY